MSMKQVILEGRLGRDAEIKTTGSGNKYVTFSLAVDDFKDGKKTTEWFNVTSFQDNHTGKFSEYLKKGKGLIVIGTPSFGTWTDRNGQTRLDLNVRATLLDFPSTGNGNKDEQKTEQEPVVRTAEKPAQAPAQNYTSTPTYTPNTTAEPEDDLPF